MGGFSIVVISFSSELPILNIIEIDNLRSAGRFRLCTVIVGGLIGSQCLDLLIGNLRRISNYLGFGILRLTFLGLLAGMEQDSLDLVIPVIDGISLLLVITKIIFNPLIAK